MSDKVTFITASVGRWHETTGICLVERIHVPVSPAYSFIPDPPARSPYRYRAQVPRPVELAEMRQDARVEYHCRYLQRHGPPSRIARVGKILGRILEDIEGDAIVLVDVTAVGMPAYYKIRQATADAVDEWRPFSAAAVNVSGMAGGVSRSADNAHIVPRRDLISEAQTAFDLDRLRVADELPLAGTLRDELLAFRETKATRNPDSLEGWREGSADDLVLAVALGIWAGERWLPTWDHIVLPDVEPLSRGVGGA
jgi:hypothetical protein